MQCKQIDDLMMKYFDGNISELELEQLLRHNQKCTRCAEEFEMMKDAIFEIEMLPDIEPPAALTANIMTAVMNQKQLRLGKSQLLCWTIGFVGLVLFTYNIFSYVILPMMGITPLVSFQSVQNLIYSMVSGVKDGFVAMSLYLGKLMVLRSVLFREHTLLIFLWLIVFVMVGLMLYKLMNMKNKNDFADIN